RPSCSSPTIWAWSPISPTAWPSWCAAPSPRSARSSATSATRTSTTRAHGSRRCPAAARPSHEPARPRAARGAGAAGPPPRAAAADSGASGAAAAGEPSAGATEAGQSAAEAGQGQVRESIVPARDLDIVYPGGFGRADFHAVKKVSFDIRAGEVYGLVGESGSGKTTIGRAIAGLTRASGGSLSVLGHEMVGFKEREFSTIRRRIGFVFQDPAASFNPHLTIGECIAEPFAIHRRQMS